MILLGYLPVVEYASTHRKVIACIHAKWPKGEAFAMHEIRHATGVSASSIKRSIATLLHLSMLKHSDRAFAGKHYRITGRWPASLEEAFDQFETARALDI